MHWNKLGRWEKVIFIVLCLLAIATRFYILGDRAMSHDESLHTKYSWQLYAGQGYQHNPMMHGPLLFHLTALAYFIFGVSDFAARFFPALAGVALVLSPWLFRRWLGRNGTIAAAIMLLLSPSISYYARYIRHDTFNMLAAILLLWAALKYLEEKEARWLYWLAASFSILYTTKETSYIYTAIFGVLLFIPFALKLITTSWTKQQFFNLFLIAVLLTILLGGVFGYALIGADVEEQSLDEAGNTRVAAAIIPIWGRIAAILALLTLLSAVGLAYVGVGEATLKQMPLFDLLMVIGTLTLPLGSAFLVRLAGVDMLTLYNALTSNNFAELLGADLYIGIFVVLAVLAGSAFLGMWWNSKHWPIIAAIHYGIFLVLFTTFFTNAVGLLSGLVSALAYWMAQQGVARGSQPTYYYLLLMPLYEYLPLVLSIGGGIGAVVYTLKARKTSEENLDEDEDTPEVEEKSVVPRPLDLTIAFPLILLGWTLLSWIAYTYAGEKMPWLVVHIALPSIFMGAWGIGHLLDNLKTQPLLKKTGWLVMLALPLVVVGWTVFAASLGKLIPQLQAGVSAAGLSLAQLNLIGQTVGGLLGFVAFFALLLWAAQQAGARQTMQLAVLVAAIFLSLLTTRTMMTLNFINYDLATEFLVYAHATPDVKVALRQIDDISWRTTGAPHDVKVAYGEDGSWPFAWYMVDYPNNYFYGTTPDAATLQECPVIIAGQPQWEAVEAITGDTYMQFDYKYLWWPIQDYYDLTWERVQSALSNPAMREALWDIIWDRDYRRYAEVQEKTITLKEWPYRKSFRLYVRRDLASEVWSYQLGEEGVQQIVQPAATAIVDPYEGNQKALTAAATISLPSATPRGLAVAPDGTLYLADTLNHRIWHTNQQGAVLDSWGEQGTGPGQFQEPWDIAMDADGNFYITDTWNHRVQKFDATGKFLLSWGTFGQFFSGDPNGQGAFFGPRGIAVSPDGEIYVTDTGNKRVQVFNSEGRFLREFGGQGRGLGQLDEPAGIAISETGEIFIADSWNHRIQVFSATDLPLRQWSIPVWDNTNPEEKPYLDLDKGGNVYVSDSGHQRVLAFDQNGTFLWSTGTYGESGNNMLFPVGVAVSDDGRLYIADAHTGRALGFKLP